MSAQEAVRTEVETNGAAHEVVQAEPQLEPCKTQLASSSEVLVASSSEVLVDSDSIYSVCCSDVTSDSPDMVRVDHVSPAHVISPLDGHGTDADHVIPPVDGNGTPACSRVTCTL